VSARIFARFCIGAPIGCVAAHALGLIEFFYIALCASRGNEPKDKREADNRLSNTVSNSHLHQDSPNILIIDSPPEAALRFSVLAAPPEGGLG
jgi:hypothetical protein